ncbi:3-hydroxyacyl-CoA dehydrogenase NAD-binding domain-containing protein [Amycolatopsis sp. NPDC004747]
MPRQALEPGDLVLASLNRAVRLYQDGYAGATAIDTAMRLGCGLPIGPLAHLNEIGLDPAYQALARLHRATGLAAYRPAELLERLAETGGKFQCPAAENLPAGEETAVPGRIGVIGSGTMARGIAHVAALAGLDVTLVARGWDKAEAAVLSIEAALAKAVAKERITPDDKAGALARLRPGVDRAAVGDCGLVVEAVAEDIDVKRGVFTDLGALCKPDAVLATTTSSLSVTECAEAAGRPADVVGMHFFNPVPAMKLVEVVRTAAAGPVALATARAVARRMGKTVVECPDRTGFIVNFLLFPYLNDAVKLLGSDLDAAAVDARIKAEFAYPMGPFELMDVIGLDISEAILWRLHAVDDDPETEPAALLSRMVRQGRLGRKSGGGFR